MLGARLEHRRPIICSMVFYLVGLLRSMIGVLVVLFWTVGMPFGHMEQGHNLRTPLGDLKIKLDPSVQVTQGVV